MTPPSEQPPRASGSGPPGPDRIPPPCSEDDVLAAISEMAAGAAHEINNPLTVISGRAQLMMERSGDDDERKVWQQVAEQSQRISDIITDLMHFANPPAPRTQEVEVAPLLETAILRFSSSNHPNARGLRFDKNIEDPARMLRADPDQIRDVLVELFTNAATAGADSIDIQLTAQAATEGAYLLFSVRDDGSGMSPEAQTHAFTPFFSSQEAGRRQGLGLPLVWRTVMANRGRIWLDSQDQIGTTAHVMLPAGGQRT